MQRPAATDSTRCIAVVRSECARCHSMGESCGNLFPVDAVVRGSSNKGHRYGAALSDADKGALLKFLKTL